MNTPPNQIFSGRSFRPTSVSAKYFKETLSAVSNFFDHNCTITYLFSNTSNHELTPFYYDILKISIENSSSFIPVPVFSQIFELMPECENDMLRNDPEERMFEIVRELRNYGYTFNITSIQSKKKFIKKQKTQVKMQSTSNP